MSKKRSTGNIARYLSGRGTLQPDHSMNHLLLQGRNGSLFSEKQIKRQPRKHNGKYLPEVLR